MAFFRAGAIFWLKVKFLGSRPYDAAGLETFLKDHFSLNQQEVDKTMKDIRKDKRFFVTAVDGSSHPMKQILYRSYSFNGNEKELEMPIWKAARASR